MRPPSIRVGVLLVSSMLTGCSGLPPSASPGISGATTAPVQSEASTWLPLASSRPTTAPPGAIVHPSRREMLFDTDVAGDDLVALAFLASAPNVDLVGITVSGTGEAHCAGGVEVVLRLLERIDAPDITVACGRETPLEGTHAFPDAWRTHVDGGSGLELPPTTRQPSTSTAVELIRKLARAHRDLNVLATGPLTNLADALLADAELAGRLGPVHVMGGALHVPGNLVCCGAPEHNDVAEWNIYVDPHAAQIVVDSGVMPVFVSLDGTNQVPISVEFAQRAMASPVTPAATVLADLFTANPFMADGSFYLWDALAAQVAAGYSVGSLSPARIDIEEAEGPESGFTRPTAGEPNIEFLSSADADAAHATLLGILSGS